MREYAKVAPTFWTGETGKSIRRRGSEGVVVAMYLMSSPHSNMLGLFYQPALYMAHETGLGIEGALKGLHICIEAGFCAYDDDTEVVWVPEMARYQIGASLSSADKRCKGIQKDYEALPNCPFLADFFERYHEAYNLTRLHPFAVANQPKTQAPSKPHRSQEQEQEQEQESPTEIVAAGAASADRKPSPTLTAKDLIAEGIDPKLASDWLRVRKAKKAILTQTAWDGVKREAAKAGLTVPAAVKLATERNWQGFMASWLLRDSAASPSAPSDDSFWDGVH